MTTFAANTLPGLCCTDYSGAIIAAQPSCGLATTGPLLVSANTELDHGIEAI